MSINRASWIRTDVKGTLYRVAAPPFTSGLRQDSVSFSAGGGEEYFQDDVRFSGRCRARGHRPRVLWLLWKGRLGVRIDLFLVGMNAKHWNV